VLVKLRYAPGWRVPGGGRNPHETPEEAVLRELREEIGLTGHGRVCMAGEFEQSVYFKRDQSALLIVEDVRYRPKWNIEVEQVAEFALGALPSDTVESTRRWTQLLDDRS
jgi:8-oxo-dGTP pyrophosphatase MutT (NUDIX family)